MKLYPTNPRQITHKGYKLLSVSLEDFGDLGGIVHNMPTDEIIGGNQRTRVFDLIRHKELITITHTYDEPTKAGTLALGYIEWKGERYSYRQVDWDAKTCQQANIQANKLGGDFDFDELANSFELDDLLEWGFDEGDFELDWGNDEEEKPDPGAQVDKAEVLLEKWGVERGQIWQCGRHRVMCGDCRIQANVEALMDGVTANLLFLDPPYGVKRDKGFGGADGFRGGSGKPIKRREYKDDWDAERPTLETFNLLLPTAKKAMIFGGNFFTDLLPVGGHWLVWDKLNTMPTFGDCELVWTNIDRLSVKKYEFQYNGLIGKEKERYHPTQKPTGLITAILGDYTESGDTVADFYFGSGTTLVACEQTNRTGFGIEIAEKYVAVTLERLTGMGLDCALLG